jgi:hypothetical protein
LNVLNRLRSNPSRSLSGYGAEVDRPKSRTSPVHGGELPPLGTTLKPRPMPRTNEVITDVIRNPKIPFHQVDDRPDKPRKHRYERRKIKEYIKLGDWSESVT